MNDREQQRLAARLEELEGLNQELHLRLEEAEQALEAIRTGEVDSLVIEGHDSKLRIFSLEGAAYSYRVLVEEMNEGAATLSEDGTVLYCNRCFSALVEEPLERAMGSSIHDYIPKRFSFDFHGVLQRAVDSSGRLELTLRSRAGREVPVYLSVNSIVDASGRVFCLVATDLREQKRTAELEVAGQALRESEARYRAIFESTGDLQFVLQASRDAQGALVGWVYRDVNEAFVRAVGQRREELIGQPPEQLVPAGDQQEVWARVLASRQPSSFEQNFRGSHYFVRVVPMGQQAVLSTATDITERKRTEEALRTSEAALRDADHHKNEFLAMLSHELRNPLTPIKNSLFVLERAEPGGDHALRSHRVIARQIDQLSRLVDDLLDLTRVSRNVVRLKAEPLDLNAVVRGTAEDYRTLFERAGVQLDARLVPGRVMITADWARLAQVIGNLLANAAKFTPKGGAARVEVEVDDAQGQAIVTVSDTGVGMAPEMLDKVFTPFAQADRTLDRSKGGLGIGLALVKRLVELHGGQVTARSEGVGAGARLEVRLPLDRGPVPQESATAPGAASSPRRVLIIEDNVDAADSLRAVLELGGHVVEVAYSGPEGLEKARTFNAQVLLCDIGLPGMDGYAVARALRESGLLGGGRLVALTGYALPNDLQKARDAGFHTHLAKPLRIELLEELLDELPDDGSSP